MSKNNPKQVRTNPTPKPDTRPPVEDGPTVTEEVVDALIDQDIPVETGIPPETGKTGV